MSFLAANARWLAGGMALTFFSSFGQTFFISLSAGGIRAEYELSHGAWGSLYMLATLASAASLPLVGQSVDRHSVTRVAGVTIIMLAAACFAMAWSTRVAVLVLIIYALRLFGQGMMTHIAMTAMGRWYAANRGRAVSVAAIGVNIGEALLPISFVLFAAQFGWRNAWIAGALMLLLMALPGITAAMSVERKPRASDPVSARPAVRDWTRAQVLRDPLFYVLLTGVLAPAFIGTTIFFHQVHLSELRGWPPEVFAAAFAVMSAMVIGCALIAGHLVDRFSAIQLLPSYLVPLGAACLVLGQFEGQWSAFAFMALLGVSYGISTTLFGALWPEIYGTAHLGAVRSIIVATMVFATALGPGITGFLIDAAVPYPFQITLMGVYCLIVTFLMIAASRTARRRIDSGPATES